MELVIDNSATSPMSQYSSAISIGGWSARPTCVSQMKAFKVALTYEGVVGDLLLKEFGELQDDWDGYGAASIDSQIISTAREAFASFVRSVPAPDISPNSNGTISFDWTSGSASAHLELGKTGFSFYLSPKTGEPFYAQDEHSIFALQRLTELISDQLYSGTLNNYSVGDFYYRSEGVRA